MDGYYQADSVQYPHTNAYVDFVNEYQSYGVEPNSTAGGYWIFAQVFLEALRQAGTVTDPNAIMEAFKIVRVEDPFIDNAPDARMGGAETYGTVRQLVLPARAEQGRGRGGRDKGRPACGRAVSHLASALRCSVDAHYRAEYQPTMTATPYLSVTDVSVSFGGVHALRGVSLTIDRGEIVGLIGPNGAGKTTLFNTITGLIRPTSGDIVFAGKSIARLPMERIAREGLVRTFQQTELFDELSVVDNVRVALHATQPQDRGRQRVRPLESRRGGRPDAGGAGTARRPRAGTGRYIYSRRA